jgi:hypothetical protein
MLGPTPPRACSALATYAQATMNLDSEKPDLVYQIGLAPRRIDLLTSISGVSFDEAWGSRVPAKVGGRDVHFIGREMFLRNKHAAGRPKDLADAARLTKARK